MTSTVTKSAKMGPRTALFFPRFFPLDERGVEMVVVVW